MGAEKVRSCVARLIIPARSMIRAAGAKGRGAERHGMFPDCILIGVVVASRS